MRTTCDSAPLGNGIEYIVNDSRDGDSDKWAKPFAVSFCDVPTRKSFKAGNDFIFSRNSSVAGPPVALAREIQQRVETGDRLEIDVAAATAVAAVGPPLWDEPLTPKTNAPVSPVTGLDIDLGFVDEHS